MTAQPAIAEPRSHANTNPVEQPWIELRRRSQFRQDASRKVRWWVLTLAAGVASYAAIIAAWWWL